MKNYKDFCAHFIKVLRGKETQSSFSEKMGYKFNVVSRWENNKKKVLWGDVLKLNQIFGWNVSKVLESVTHSEYSKNPNTQELLRGILKNDRSLKAVEKEFSKQKIFRLRAGSVRLQFNDFLKILNCVYGRDERFLNLLLGEETVKNIYKSLGECVDGRDVYRELVVEDPLYSLILNCIQIGAYQKLGEHSDEFVAKKIGLSEDQVSFRIEHLLRSGVLQKREGLYHKVNAERHHDLGARSDKSASKAVSRLLRAKSLEESDNQNKEESNLKHAFLIYPSNVKLNKEVFELTKNFYKDVQNLVNEVDASTTENLSYISLDIFEF